MKFISRTRRHQAVLLTSIVSLLFFGACSHQKPKSEEPETNSSALMDKEIGSSDLGNAMGLKSIHFSFDANTLDSQNKAVLVEDSQVLKSNPKIKVQVEGHCDARGGTQYNIALGEKRAIAVKHFLQDQGIDENRIATISYGKERPIDPAQTDEAYAKNRRANFVITSK